MKIMTRAILSTSVQILMNYMLIQVQSFSNLEKHLFGACSMGVWAIRSFVAQNSFLGPFFLTLQEMDSCDVYFFFVREGLTV
jgi:hypothetical protein